MIAPMPRDGATLFSDLIGKLDVLRVTCDVCKRDGCYGLAVSSGCMVATPKLRDWLDVITADCPKKIARNDYSRCGAKCPQLSKVLQASKRWRILRRVRL